MTQREPVAIVGLGGLFPGGPDLETFWRNISSGIDAGRPVPAGRWAASPEHTVQPGDVVPDKTYSNWGCYLDEIPLAASLRQHDPELIAQLDPVCRLALQTAGQALDSARMESVDRQRIGVILGHIVLPSEAASALSRDIVLRTFAERVLNSSSQSPPTASAGWHPRNRRIAALPAELIAEWFDLGGTAFTLDAACASSLYALKLAVDELQAGRADAMLAGGLSRPDCQYTQIGFAQLQALSKRGKCAPFSTKADGLVVGEGAGLFVLKRLHDALRDGDRVEAVIAGIGISNDRGANLLAPHSEGQLRAMRAAYEQAGWVPEDVEFMECHATGTPTGDAVELASLHQLWADRPARPGQCVLGAVKSNVGHLLTGAGGAGLMKLIGMFRAQQFWPIANFHEPATALQDPHSPFRVVAAAEPWPTSHSDRPRRAAINAFGFGGINAHVLIEEHLPSRPVFRQQTPPTVPTAPLPEIVIIGVEATIGPWADLAAVKDRLFAEAPAQPQLPEMWGADLSSGLTKAPSPSDFAAFGIDRIEMPVGEFRIPPREVPDLLPQQQLMLQVTARALDQAQVGRSLGDRTGVFLGVSLDPNTTNYHCRWMIAEQANSWAHQLGLSLDETELAAWINQLQEAFGPPLTPNRVMGNLAAITASRIAREFDVGGPCFTLSADEDSGLRSLQVAVESLQRGDLDLAVIGAVEFNSDIRAQWADRPEVPAHDGALAFILKRRVDADRDNNPILATIDLNPRLPLRESPTPKSSSAAQRLGYGLATAGLVEFLQNLLCLTDGLSPDQAQPSPWLHDRRDGFRERITPSRRGVALRLQEVPQPLAPVQSLGIMQQIVVIDGDNRNNLLSQLDSLETVTRREPRTTNSHAIVLVGKTDDELRAAMDEARRHLQQESPGDLQSDHVTYTANPLGITGKVAFVFPGSGNAFPGMGRELLSAFPGVLQRQHAENEQLRGQYRPELIWDSSSTEAIGGDHKAMIFSQVALGTALCDLLNAFGVRPAASIGYSLGESAALFGLRIWQDRDDMLERMRQSPLFGRNLVFPFDAARNAWNIPDDQPVPWVAGVINAPPEIVREAVSRKTKVDLLIINTPSQCVIGGDDSQVQAVVEELAARFVPFRSPSTVHCQILNEVRREYLELHRLPTTPQDGIDVYSSATGQRYGVSRDAAAGAILAQAVDTVDFPQVIRQAYRDGVRLFLEIGPGYSCTRMIDEILANDPHWAGAVCPATSDPIGQFLSVLAQLIAHRVPVDLSPLMPQSVRHQLADDRQRIVTPVGHAAFQELPMPVRKHSKAKVETFKGVDDAADLTGPLSPVPGERSRVRELDHDHGRTGGQPAHLAFDHRFSPGEEERSSIPVTTLSQHVDIDFAASPAASDVIATFGALLSERAAAHAAFLSFSQRSQELAARLINAPTKPGDGIAGTPSSQSADFETEYRSTEPPRSLNYDQCLQFAIGNIGDVLGPLFAEIDQFPTRVRLPDEPLMLCHRILEIDGEPLSMSHGRLVTEHDIADNAWYLDCGRIPTCIAVEAGQADLFLSGWLGIDFETRGLAVYRLLDAVVTFHDALPGPGQTIRYEIRINQFFRQGETWLFRFDFDATVDGRPLLTMREGCAGFFTQEALALGKGIVHTALDRQPRPGIRPADWTDPVPMTVERFSDQQLTALRRGDFTTCFGSPFRGLPINNPVTIPDGTMRLVDRVLHLDPSGGKYGLGLIRAEADIHPDDWFLTCHFCDDQVMPGTLMYECCLHTLRIYLLRMGWIGDTGDIVYEPIPEVRSRLKCRGQVLSTTKKVWYEVTIKELGYGTGQRRERRSDRDRGIPLAPPLSPLADSSAYCLADALMYADGRPIVEMTDMSVRLTGLTQEKVERLWSASSLSGGRQPPDSALGEHRGRQQRALAPRSETSLLSAPQPLFDTDRITEFAIGKPSLAFGDKYRIFDEDRVIARLPGPPFQFLDRITSIENCEPWKLTAGGVIVAEYDVPPDAWYFAANRQPTMPFAVLLEAALQPCGWLAGYLGSALTSDVDLSFRNLGGKATQFQAVTAASSTLTTTVKITSVSQSAGMIIQHYSFDLRCRGEPVYQGTTYFGFFSKSALANQIGIRDAVIYQPTSDELAHACEFAVPRVAPFPADQFRMVDRVDVFLPDGGPHGLGYLRGTIDVDPAFWFFKSHFYQDPVWPGSLGLESFLQLLKVYAAHRWTQPGDGIAGTPPSPTAGFDSELQFQTVALNASHEWVYRGQVIPEDKTVTVEVVITAVDDARRLAAASGFLMVDGRVIYQMIDFTITVES